MIAWLAFLVGDTQVISAIYEWIGLDDGSVLRR